MDISKSDESCISNPKLEIVNWTVLTGCMSPICDFEFRIWCARQSLVHLAS